jgi:hypothetical protein
MPYQNNLPLPSTVTEDGLVGYWSLDEGFDDAIYDSSAATPVADGTFNQSLALRGIALPLLSMKFVDTGSKSQKC